MHWRPFGGLRHSCCVLIVQILMMYSDARLVPDGFHIVIDLGRNDQSGTLLNLHLSWILRTAWIGINCLVVDCCYCWGCFCLLEYLSRLQIATSRTCDLVTSIGLASRPVARNIFFLLSTHTGLQRIDHTPVDRLRHLVVILQCVWKKKKKNQKLHRSGWSMRFKGRGPAPCTYQGVHCDHIMKESLTPCLSHSWRLYTSGVQHNSFLCYNVPT